MSYQSPYGDAATVANVALVNGEDAVNDVVVVEQGQYDYELCAAGSDVTCGVVGAVGDFLHALHMQTGVTSVLIKDGASTIYTWTPVSGETEKEFNMVSKLGAWVINATGGSVLAVGRFA